MAVVPAEGAHAVGVISDAAVVMNLANGVVRGRIAGSYEGLGIEFMPTRERDQIHAALNNLGISLQVPSSNASEPVARRVTPIARKMDPGHRP